jgi:Na+/H+ antiporter NhaC
MNAKLKYAIGFLIFIGLCLIFQWRAGQVSGAETLLWYSIIPPLLAVTLAIVTARLFPSLCIAVGVGLVLSWYQKGGTPSGFLAEAVWFVRAVSVGNDGIDLFNFWVVLFVFLIMATISVVVASGGIGGVVVWLSQFAKGPRSAQFITGLMGIIIFIGDYSNAMLVGPTMRPLTDHHRVSREKLAFLVDSTSAPIAGLAFVSTWIGYEVGLFEDISGTLGLGRDGYSMFFDALSFRFYCVLTIIFVIVNAISGRDYGAMHQAETRARETGDIAAPDAEALGHAASFTSLPNAVVQPFSAVLPLLTLFGLLLGGFWIDGNGTGSILSLTSWRNALSEANNVMVLACAAASAFVVSIICARWLSKLRFSDIAPVVWNGIKGSLTPLGILLLAWGLKASCDRLMTGDFLATMLSDVVSPLWFPIFVFICGAVTSFATGTSWGTMAILIPTAIPVAFSLDGDSYGLTTIICLGAVLDGAIFGDHCSPLSDTTILSSIASSCDPLHHVRTQLPYSLTVASIALFCGYLPAALGLSSAVGIAGGTAVIILLFYGVAGFRKFQERSMV